MALLGSRSIAHFNSPSPSSNVPDIHQQNPTASTASDEYLCCDDQLDGDLRKQLAQWTFPSPHVATSNTNLQTAEISTIGLKRPRKSSLKDTSKMKFPRTPKTKTVCWQKDEFLVSYQEIKEDTKRKTDERPLLKKASKSTNKRNAVQFPPSPNNIKPYCSKVLKLSKLTRISSPPKPQIPSLPQCQSHTGDLWPRPTYRTGSHEFIASNQEFYAANGSHEENCECVPAFVPRQRCSVCEFVRGFWVMLKENLRAVSIKLGNVEWAWTKAPLCEEEQNLLVGSTRNSSNLDIPTEERTRDNVSIDTNLDRDHLRSKIRPQSRITRPNAEIITFNYQSKSPLCSHPRHARSRFVRLWNWRRSVFSSKSRLLKKIRLQNAVRTNRKALERSRLLGLHSRCTPDILQIRKLYNKMLRRDRRKEESTKLIPRRQGILNVLSSGTGLPVIFEEEEEEEEEGQENSAGIQVFADGGGDARRG